MALRTVLETEIPTTTSTSPDKDSPQLSVQVQTVRTEVHQAIDRAMFDRGMVNIVSGYKLVETPGADGEVVVSVAGHPDDVVCRYRVTPDGGHIATFTDPQRAAWFEDGLNW